MAEKDQPKGAAKNSDERKPVVGMPFELEDVVAAAITAIVLKRRANRVPRRGARR
jgi:hypothetical protein